MHVQTYIVCAHLFPLSFDRSNQCAVAVLKHIQHVLELLHACVRASDSYIRSLKSFLCGASTQRFACMHMITCAIMRMITCAIMRMITCAIMRMITCAIMRMFTGRHLPELPMANTVSHHGMAQRALCRVLLIKPSGCSCLQGLRVNDSCTVVSALQALE
jgi:hypothetical protein